MFSSNTTQVSSGGYQISRSLRFNSADSAYLNRTPASAGNRRTFTYSAWVKRSFVGTGFDMCLLNGYVDNSNRFSVDFANASNANLYVLNNTSGSSTIALSTTAIFRDPSAWYHVVVAIDTTQATSTNRVLVYVNGVSQTLSGTYPSQNEQLIFNYGIQQTIGVAGYSGLTNYFSGYQTEANFIDGQALTPSSFGETNAQTGVWQPKAYSGSYGTNGFYLNFSDNSNTTAATLGKDYSGNGNNWTPNNFSVTAGAGNDSLVDSPTSYGTDTGVGGTVRGNYCTLNPLDTNSAVTISNGNLLGAKTGASASGLTRATFGLSSGKWYWEATQTTTGGANNEGLGIANNSASLGQYIGENANSWSYWNGGVKISNNSQVAYGATYTVGDVIGIALDMDAGTITFYKNGTSQGQAYSGITGTVFAAFSCYGSAVGSFVFNFGQRPFAYTVPSGFKALCTQNLPTPTIGATTATQAGKFFAPVLYAGNGASSRAVTGVGFQPDFVWLKARNYAFVNGLWDSVRGGGKLLISNLTLAEITNDPNGYVSSFDSDGFTLTAGTTNNDTFNGSANSMVSWNWKANGSGSTNTSGSITSTVSANTTSGFSVVKWTQPASGTYTIGHGLGVAPAMIFMKSTTLTSNWAVYHQSIGYTQYGRLNTTDSFVSDSSVWVASPTSSVFSQLVNYGTGGTSVAYCFAEVAGYSKFGSYTGNSSNDGPFVYCGFRPRYIMVKCTSESVGPGSGWHIIDTARSTYNAATADLFANANYDEATIGNVYPFDINSNGFKLRTSNSYVNNSGQTYIFAAFAEAPFKYSLAR